MSERFLLMHVPSGRRAQVSLPGTTLEGDPEICQEVEPFLREPVLAIRGSFDPRTGERGTTLQQLAMGTGPWLEECLCRAALALGLQVLVDLP
ncbi:MAG: hypothetical protein ACYDEA_01990 [Candidatus Dormibacteria bacterium]